MGCFNESVAGRKGASHVGSLANQTHSSVTAAHIAHTLSVLCAVDLMTECARIQL